MYKNKNKNIINIIIKRQRLEVLRIISAAEGWDLNNLIEKYIKNEKNEKNEINDKTLLKKT